MISPAIALADTPSPAFHPGPLPGVARDVTVRYRAAMDRAGKDTYRIRLRIKRGGMPYVIDFPNAAREHSRPWMPYGGFDDSYWVVDTRPDHHGYYIDPTNREYNELYKDWGPLVGVVLVSYARSMVVAGQPCEVWNAVRSYPKLQQRLEVCLSRDAVVLRVKAQLPGFMDSLEAEAVTSEEQPTSLFEVPPGYPHELPGPPPPPNATLGPYDATDKPPP